MITKHSEQLVNAKNKNRRSFLKLLGTGLGVASVTGLAGCINTLDNPASLAIDSTSPIQLQDFTNDELIMISQDSRTRWGRALRKFVTLRENGNPSNAQLEDLRDKIRDAREISVDALKALAGSRFEIVANENLRNVVETGVAVSTARELIASLRGTTNLVEEDNFINQLWSFLDSNPKRVHATADIFAESESIVTHLRKQIKNIKAQTLISGLKGNSNSVTANCQDLENSSFLLIAASSQICQARSGSSDCDAVRDLAAIATAIAFIGCDFGGLIS